MACDPKTEKKNIVHVDSTPNGNIILQLTFANVTAAALTIVPSGTTKDKITKCVTSANRVTDLKVQKVIKSEVGTLSLRQKP